MRVRTAGATPVFTNRSHQLGYREIQADRLLRVVQELLAQASKAARAGDVEFLAQRLDEADRILRRLARGKQAQRTNNKQVQRAKKRSSDLRLGVLPLPTRRASPPSNALEVMANSSSMGGGQEPDCRRSTSPILLRLWSPRLIYDSKPQVGPGPVREMPCEVGAALVPSMRFGMDADVDR